MGPAEKMMEQIFNLKFTAKQLQRSALKCEKEEKAERLKVKKAIEKGNLEGANIYAQNAIRKKNEQLNYMKLASRLDAVVSRLDSQAKMQSVTTSIGNIVKNLEKAMASNNLEKIAGTMQQFELQFENLDLQTQVVDGVMSQQQALSTPPDQVAQLIEEVREAHGLELKVGLPGAATTSVAAPAAAERTDVADLSSRLNELKGR